MGWGIALASGFVRELNQIEKEKRASAAKQAEADSAWLNFQREASFKAGLDAQQADLKWQRDQDAAYTKWIRDSNAQDKKSWVEGVKAMPEDVLMAAFKSSQFREDFKTNMGIDLPDNVFELANTLNNEDNLISFGTVAFKKPDIGEKQLNVYNQGYIPLQSFNDQLLNDEFYNKTLDTLQNNETARTSFLKYLSAREKELIEGYDIIQRGDKEKEPGVLYTTNLTTFGRLNQLVQSLGTEAIAQKDEETNKKVREIAGTPPGQSPLLFATTTNENGITKNVARNIDDADMKLINQVSSRLQLSPQELVNSLSTYRNIPTKAEFSTDIYEGLSDDEIADKQYIILENIMELERRGFGEILQDPLSASPAKRAELQAFLNETYGSDRYTKAVVLGYMMPTDKVFLVKPKSGVLYEPIIRETGITVNGKEYMKKTGYTDAEMKEISQGYKYATQTVQLLNQLMNLESTALKDAQGFARETKRVLLGFGVQIGQLSGVFKDIFSDNDVFQGNYKGTVTAESIGESAKKILGVDDLANISEADALKLTLAARMARAIDPSGRLSNQDFEIQLQRLGNALLGDAKTVQRNLEVVMSDFQKEVQRNAVLATIIDDNTQINAVTARAITADRRIQRLEDAAFEDSSTETQIDAKASDTTTPMENYIPSRATVGGNPVFIRKGGDGPLYILEDGTSVARNQFDK